MRCDYNVQMYLRSKADLGCYECTRTADNDSCALSLELVPEITAHGQVGKI